MSNIPNSSSKIQTEAVQYQAPVSESSLTSIGGAINYCLDTVATNSSSISTLQSQMTNLNRLKLVQVLAQNVGTYTVPAGRYFIGRFHPTSIGGATSITMTNRYSETRTVWSNQWSFLAGPSPYNDPTIYMEAGDAVNGVGGNFNMVGIEFQNSTGP